MTDNPIAKQVCFTSCNIAYLNKAAVLAKTFKQHHPDWIFNVLLSDVGNRQEIMSTLPTEVDGIVFWDDLDVPSPVSWSFCHDAEELCTAVKPFYSSQLLDEGVGTVLFLDPDIAVFRRLDEIDRYLEENSILLIPHLWEPVDDTRHIELHEISTLAHGIFNLGFFAVKNDQGARDGMRFWKNRTAKYCYRDHASGLFTDQKWVNLFPIYFDGVKILKERTLNISSWNLINIELNGSYPDVFASGLPVGFIHFSGIDHDVFTYASAQVGQLTNTVLQLIEWYKGAIALETRSTTTGKGELLHYQSGRRIRKAHRIAYRSDPTLISCYSNPYDDLSVDSYYRRFVEKHEQALIDKYENPHMIPRRY